MPDEPGYKLFWEALSGAMAVELFLEQAGIAYERIPIDMASGEHKSAAFLSLNPTGQIPALMLPSGQVIGESAAILLLLGERHPDCRLVPLPGSADRPGFLRWLVYMAASPYMTFVQFNHPERFLADRQAHGPLIENARARLLDQFTLLNDAIAGEPYFQRAGLSALDLYLYMLIEFFADRDTVYSGRDRLAGLHRAVSGLASTRRVRPRHG
ncbi:MAG: glutathione S-transferase family protein [Geminicoccaceae bacterium]